MVIFTSKTNYLTNGNTYWECAERRRGNGCKAKMRLDPANEIIYAANEHTHEPDSERIAVIKARAGMKQKKQMHQPITFNA